MLGEIAPDLQDALGVDVVPLGGPRTMFGFENTGWKPWTTFDGTPVLVPAGFNTEPEPNGDILMYPEGDRSAPPSGRMPKGGFYFDSIIRQEPIDEDRLDPARQPGGVRPRLRRRPGILRRRVGAAAAGRAIGRFWRNFGGTAFGDIALVPAPWLKHPKGIRDVAEWYISTAARFDYVYEVFQRQCEIAPGEPGEDLRRGGRSRDGCHDHRHGFRHPERAVHQSGQLSQALHALPSPRERLDPPAHALEDVHPLLRVDHQPCCRTSSRRVSTSSTRCSVRRWAWTRRR